MSFLATLLGGALAGAAKGKGSGESGEAFDGGGALNKVVNTIFGPPPPPPDPMVLEKEEEDIFLIAALLGGFVLMGGVGFFIYSQYKK